MHITTRKLAAAAVTGAAYAALTMLLAPISYGAIQCRVSEVLCILPFFIPCTAWGLFAGCAIANLLSAAGIFDVVFGSLATLLAALCTGVTMGVGYALIYMQNSSTGGADFVVMAMKAVRPHLSLGKLAFVTDVAIVLAGAAALVYGIISWRNGGDFGMYFALFGFAAIFFFSGAHVLPTAKNNKKAVARAWEEAQANLAHVLPDDFPLPARYAHPVVLTRMIRILREGRAQSADEALEVLKSDLKALNADVQVSQEEYDEVVAIKSMFLLSDYQ